MEETLAAAIILSGIGFGAGWHVFGLVLLLLILLALIIALLTTFRGRRPLHRAGENPVLGPVPEHPWESEAVFNPAAIYDRGRVHILYRALGHDGVSRIGYASSPDGVHFDERLAHPVYVPAMPPPSKFRNPFAPATPLTYNPDMYASGGGWGGSEDPRAVKIGDRVYMTFGMFESWASLRMAITSIQEEDFHNGRWHWAPHFHISPANQTNKNWVLFPEKIGGRFAVLHALTPRIMVEYVDSLEELRDRPIQSNNHRSGRKGYWDSFVRGAGAPPIKTKYGWLLLYHGMDTEHSEIGYKLGAMLLDLADPTHILYRSAKPILEPTEWYENDWKPGVIYASGAVVKDGTLFVYYGGGDKTVNVATANLERFLQDLMHREHAVLEKPRL